MPSTKRAVITFIGIYLTIGLMCFGHAAANTEVKEKPYSSITEQRVTSGIFAAVFWPAYLSWVIFEKSDKVEK